MRRLVAAPRLDHLREGFLAERFADGADELHGEVAVPVGEDGSGRNREAPPHRRSSAPSRSRRSAFHESGGLQRLEVLTYGGVGQAERRGQLGCRGRLDAFEVLDQPHLGAGERLGGWRHPAKPTGISEVMP